MSDLSTLQKSLIFLTIAIAIVFTFIFIDFHFGQRCALPEANSIGKRCGNPVANFLYDFQSLIGGILAVAAAFFTIRQMQATDAEQAKHHRELIDIQLFQQQVSIQQGCELIRALFISSTPALVRLRNTIKRDGNSAAMVFPDAEEYAIAFRNVESFLNSPSIARVEPLIGGDVVLQLLLARNAANRLADFVHVSTLDDPDDASDKEILDFVDFFTVRYLDIFKHTNFVLSALDKLNNELGALKKRFGEPQLFRNGS
ncbi:hypothetical protein Brsp05_02280 [Brucella sp. NBRC 12953]|uniref:hypothetical protein n=1 Tax=Brucella sp. NBRC 12953 TaxID=3075481 RepID=UPI000DE221BD